MREHEEELHDLDYGNIDDLDEIDESEQLALVWCDTHQEFEWHWIPLGEIPGRRRRRYL